MRCPSCKNEFRTISELATHTCPTETSQDPSKETIQDAVLRSQLAHAARMMKRPTPENLQNDADTILRHIHNNWDGEVEAVVIIVPVGAKDAVVRSSCKSFDRIRALLRSAITAFRGNPVPNA